METSQGKIRGKNEILKTHTVPYKSAVLLPE